ncbi:hypothetical protein HNQ63_002023 [Wenzhouxiangella marina]|uniref:Uncharacterized protein n=1 Tax=Wenzhouxiangella marina TaxID=1579979 RepID=A0A0K0XYS0_9GAMM|nr:hypothetical protein WM2015_2409 [Wenzhouxiangella marina]MBB6087551.1 hypothetical protein [Wenzhouxiangella marina]
MSQTSPQTRLRNVATIAENPTHAYPSHHGQRHAPNHDPPKTRFQVATEFSGLPVRLTEMPEAWTVGDVAPTYGFGAVSGHPGIPGHHGQPRYRYRPIETRRRSGSHARRSMSQTSPQTRLRNVATIAESPTHAYPSHHGQRHAPNHDPPKTRFQVATEFSGLPVGLTEITATWTVGSAVRKRCAVCQRQEAHR